MSPNRLQISVAVGLPVVFAIVAVVAFMIGDNDDDRDAAPAQSTVSASSSAAAPVPTPVAQVGPVDRAFRDATEGEVWYGHVLGIHIYGDLLIATTTLDVDDDAPASVFICQAMAAAIESTGTQGIRGITVESSSGATLAGRFDGMTACKDYE